MIILKLDKSKIKVYAVFLLLTGAVGGISAIFTTMGMDEYAKVQKPVLTPPDFIFPLVWTVLYILMAVSASRVWLSDNKRLRNHGIIVYALQLFFNFFWSILFFTFQTYGLSFMWIIGLWLMIVIMIVRFYSADKLAGLLQIPYLLWVSFAAYLNFMVWMLNK